MSEPDPDFVKWFGGDWQRRLSAVAVPGMADASWDRKAAWLLWCAEHPTFRPPFLATPSAREQTITISVFD